MVLMMDFFPGFPVPVTLVFDSAQQSRGSDASGSFPVSPEGRRRWLAGICQFRMCHSAFSSATPSPSIS